MGQDLTALVHDEAAAKAAERGLEVKSHSYGTKVLDEQQGIAEMIVAVTGVEDHVHDIIEPGAIGPGLKSRWPKGIWHHTWEQPICKTLEAEELMPGDPRLPTKARGMESWPPEAGAFVVKSQFNLDTQRGREAFSDVKFFGDDGEWSIGYKVGKATRGKDGIRRIKSMEVPEYSPVLFGAMPLTSTISTKGQTFTNENGEPETKAAMVNLPGSYEERLDSIEDAIEAMLPSQGIDAAHCYVRVVGTYADRVVYAVTEYGDGDSLSSDSDETYYEANYSTGDQGQIVVGVPHVVDVSAQVTEKSDDPLVAALETAGDLLMQQKAGRPVSGANLAKVRAAAEALGEVLVEAVPEYKVEDEAKAVADLDEVIAAVTEVKSAILDKNASNQSGGTWDEKGSPDQARDDHGRWSSGGSGAVGESRASLLSQNHRGMLTKARGAIDHVLRSAASLSALAGFPNAAKNDDAELEEGLTHEDGTKDDGALRIEVKADPMAKKPHDYKAGDDGKCATCGTAVGNPMHHVGKAAPEGEDYQHHEFAPNADGDCATCGRNKGDPIHELPEAKTAIADEEKAELLSLVEDLLADDVA